MNLNFNQAMKTNYTKEEEEIVTYVEEKNPNSVSDLESEKKRYSKIFKDNFTKRKAINLRILESDLREIKNKALEDGIPYQTLITSIIHKYVNGTLSK